MAKIKTLDKQEKSLHNKPNPTYSIKKNVGIKRHDPLKQLLNKKFIGKAIIECLENNDPEGVLEMLLLYIKTLNKAQTIQKTKNIRTRKTRSISKKHTRIIQPPLSHLITTEAKTTRK